MAPAVSGARWRAARVLLPLLLAALVAAHPHHHDGPADDSVPIDSILWIHMLLQGFTWIVLFPLTMVMGLVRHRLHVPLSILSLLLTTAGYFLGHGHGGRSFPHTAHGTIASLLIFYLGAQAALGLYLKLHLRWAPEKFVRPPLLFVHGVLGRLFPIVGWTQCLLGIFTLRSWCFGAHKAQCVGYHGVGSAIQAYAVVMLIMTKVAVGWLQRTGRSQEWLDSLLLMLWGGAIGLAQLRSGLFDKSNIQNTMLGLLWVIGGATGIYFSRGGRRTAIPGLLIAVSGAFMAGSTQKLALANSIHALLGYVLLAAGVARIIEVCFVLKENPSWSNGPVDGTGLVSTSARSARRTDSEGRTNRNSEEEEESAELERELDSHHHRAAGGGWYHVHAFQYLPPFLLTAAGTLFMSATDEQLKWADGQGMNSATWALLDFSIAVGLFLWYNILIDLYIAWGGYRGLAGGASGRPGEAAHGGQLERGSHRSEYVPLTARGSAASTAASGRPQRSVAVAANGTTLAGNRDSSQKVPQHGNGAGAFATGAPRGAVVELTQTAAQEPKQHAREGRHVLFAESDAEGDEDDDDPFDDDRER